MTRFTISAVIGLFVIATLADLAWAGGQGQKTIPGQQGTATGMVNQTPWFGNPQIRQQLKFNDEQFNRLNKAYGESWQRYQERINALDKNLTPEQRAQKYLEAEREFYTGFAPTTSQVITDADMRNRFNQFQLQYRGYSAFSDPQMQDRLKLTPEQRQKLNQLETGWNRQMTDLGTFYRTNPDQANLRYNQIRTQTNSDINGVLTPDQQRTWQEIMGPTYNFPASTYFPSTSPPSK